MVATKPDLIEEEEDKKKKKEPSPFSMRTEDILAALEKSSSTVAGSSMRALTDIDRHRAVSQPKLDQMQRQREAEVMAERDTSRHPQSQKQQQIVGYDEWARIQYPHLAKKPYLTPREDKTVRTGYAMYRATQDAQAKAQLSRRLNEARIGTERARALSLGRANQPRTLAAGMMWHIQRGLPIPPDLSKAYNAGFASQERIATEAVGSKEGIEGRKLRRNVQKWRAERGDKRMGGALDRDLAMEQTRANIAGRMDVARLKGGIEEPLVTDASIRSIIVAGKNIGKVGKAGEKADFETWMLDTYLPIARSTTPEQRAAIRKGMGDRIPPTAELLDLIVVPARTPEKKGFWIRDVPEQPAKPEAVEEGTDTVDWVLEALRLHGVSDTKIDQLRAMYSGQLEAAGSVDAAP